MKTYQVKIKTETDTMLGSGQSLPGAIDSDIRYDENGIPYMNAKTMKGYLGEQMRWIYSLYPEKFAEVSLSELLGSPDTEGIKRTGKLRFSAVQLSAGIADRLKKAVKEKTVTKEEILDSMTVIFSYTSLDEEGIAKDHTLRRIRMIRGGMTFESNIYVDEISPLEEELLAYALCSLQHIGMEKSKGKGVVRCDIFENGESLRDRYLKGGSGL